MIRTVWFLAGAGAGVYAAQRARRAVEAFSPDGLRDRVGAWELGGRLFLDEFRAGRAEGERDVRSRLGLEPGTSSPPAAPLSGTRPALTPEKRDRP